MSSTLGADAVIIGGGESCSRWWWLQPESLLDGLLDSKSFTGAEKLAPNRYLYMKCYKTKIPLRMLWQIQGTTHVNTKTYNLNEPVQLLLVVGQNVLWSPVCYLLINRLVVGRWYRIAAGRRRRQWFLIFFAVCLWFVCNLDVWQCVVFPGLSWKLVWQFAIVWYRWMSITHQENVLAKNKIKKEL